MTKEEIVQNLKYTMEKHKNDTVNTFETNIAAMCKDILDYLEQEPKTGRWIIKEGREQGYDIAGIKTWYVQIMCDKCGFIKTAIEGHTGQYKFCPNCGQPMMQEVKECENCKHYGEDLHGANCRFCQDMKLWEVEE